MDEINFKKLTLPFKERDIEWRIQQSGVKEGKPWALVLAYVTNRAIMERLDEVAGPQRWQNQFMVGPSGGVLCGIGIEVGFNWVWKWDGAENTDIEAIKGGLSGSMKRAAVQWGVGRYLYDLDVGWAVFDEKGKYRDKFKEGTDTKWHKWNPPKLPNWALPQVPELTEEKPPEQEEKPETQVEDL